MSDSRHIFSKHPMGSHLLNNAAILRPEVTVILLASSLPGNTVRLARESSGNKINCFKAVLSAFSDISIPPNIRPVFRQYP